QALALTVALSLSAAGEPATVPSPPAPVELLAAVAASSSAAPVRSVIAARAPFGRATPALSLASRAMAPPQQWRWLLALGASAGGWLSPALLTGIDAAVALRAAPAGAPPRSGFGWGA